MMTTNVSDDRLQMSDCRLQIAGWQFAICNYQFAIAALGFIALLLLAVTSTAAELLDPALPYQAEKSSAVMYDVDLSIVVTPPYHTHLLKVWLPVPPSDAGQEASTPSYSTFPQGAEPRITRE